MSYRSLFKRTFYWNSSGAGLIFLALVIPSLCSPLVGISCDKYGSKVIATTGLLGAVPFWVLLRLVTHDSIDQKVLLGVFLAFIGLGLTFLQAPLMADLDHTVALEEKKRPGNLGKGGAAAQGYGLFNMVLCPGNIDWAALGRLRRTRCWLGYFWVVNGSFERTVWYCNTLLDWWNN